MTDEALVVEPQTYSAGPYVASVDWNEWTAGGPLGTLYVPLSDVDAAVYRDELGAVVDWLTAQGCVVRDERLPVPAGALDATGGTMYPVTEWRDTPPDDRPSFLPLPTINTSAWDDGDGDGDQPITVTPVQWLRPSPELSAQGVVFQSGDS